MATKLPFADTAYLILEVCLLQSKPTWASLACCAALPIAKSLWILSPVIRLLPTFYMKRLFSDSKNFHDNPKLRIITETFAFVKSSKLPSYYPFTAPLDIPPTMYFCPTMNTNRTGTIVRIISALTRFHEFSNAPKKL
jgi:hypothetical protein